jgi:hypothetical protein
MAKHTRAPARRRRATDTARPSKTRAPKRASARRSDKRAPARRSDTRAIESRRLRVTPALLADVRRRFERSDEPLATMAADFGCSIETVRNIAKRERWLRYQPPPRDLSPAARLAARAAALAMEQGAAQNDPAPAPAQPPQEQPLLLADTAEQLHRELQTLLAELTATRARMKRERAGKHDLRQTSQVIASLTATLRALQPMLCAVPPAGADHAYDDVPADIDEFREALARRIEAFMQSRPDEDELAETDAAGTDPA